MLNIFSDLWNMLYEWNSDLVYFVLMSLGTVVLFIVGGLLMHWAFGGKKTDQKKNDKLFETTAFSNAVRPTLPRKFR